MEEHIEVAARLKPDSRDRKCRDCGVPVSAENLYPSCLKRCQWVCKTCWNGRFYLAVRRRKYGLGKQQFRQMCEAQNWLCAICDEQLTERLACLDHDHATGKARGILCKKCNSGLGMFRDSLNMLESACEYMRKRRSK